MNYLLYEDPLLDVVTIGILTRSVTVAKIQGRTLGVAVKFRTHLRENPVRTSGAVSACLTEIFHSFIRFLHPFTPKFHGKQCQRSPQNNFLNTEYKFHLHQYYPNIQ